MALGEQLRKARLAKKETVSQVAAATRIKVQQVEAIEREDFSKVPAPIYGKGFIKLYAEYVGLDPQPLIDEYVTRFVSPTRPFLDAVVLQHPLAEPPRPGAPTAGPEAKTQAAPKTEKKPRGRRPEREFAEPDLFSRLETPPPPSRVGPAALPSETPPPPPGAAPGPVSRAAEAPKKDFSAEQPLPARTAAGPGGPVPGEELRPLKLEGERAMGIDMARVQSALRQSGEILLKWCRQGTGAMAEWANKIAVLAGRISAGLQVADVRRSPVKLAIVALGVLIVLVFLISGLSRLLVKGSGGADSAKPRKELRLTVDPPAPYFE